MRVASEAEKATFPSRYNREFQHQSAKWWATLESNRRWFPVAVEVLSFQNLTVICQAMAIARVPKRVLGSTDFDSTKAV